MRIKGLMRTSSTAKDSSAAAAWSNLKFGVSTRETQSNDMTLLWHEDRPELISAAMRSVSVDPIWSGRCMTRSARLSSLGPPQ